MNNYHSGHYDQKTYSSIKYEGRKRCFLVFDNPEEKKADLLAERSDVEGTKKILVLYLFLFEF